MAYESLVYMRWVWWLKRVILGHCKCQRRRIVGNARRGFHFCSGVRRCKQGEDNRLANPGKVFAPLTPQSTLGNRLLLAHESRDSPLSRRKDWNARGRRREGGATAQEEDGARRRNREDTAPDYLSSSGPLARCAKAPTPEGLTSSEGLSAILRILVALAFASHGQCAQRNTQNNSDADSQISKFP